MGYRFQLIRFLPNIQPDITADICLYLGHDYGFDHCSWNSLSSLDSSSAFLHLEGVVTPYFCIHGHHVVENDYANVRRKISISSAAILTSNMSVAGRYQDPDREGRVDAHIALEVTDVLVEVVETDIVLGVGLHMRLVVVHSDTSPGEARGHQTGRMLVQPGVLVVATERTCV